MFASGVAAGLLFSPATALAQAPINLVEDAGFEDPVGVDTYFSSGPMGAWDVTEVSGTVGLFGDGTFGGSNVTEGNQAVDLGMGGFATGNSISQSLPTVAGQRYRLSFDWGSEYGWGAHSRVTVGDLDEVLVSDPTSATSCPEDTWIEHRSSFEFVATGDDVLTFTDLSDNDLPGPCSASGGFTLDNVVVTPNLVRDGGFEQPVGINEEYGTGPMGAWDVTRVSDAVGIVGDGTFVGSNVVEGNQAFDLGLGGFSTGNSIAQTLPTIAGQKYRISYRWGSEYGWGTHSRVTVGDLDEVIIDPPASTAGPGPSGCPQQTWIVHTASFEFTAAGNDVLTFTDLTDASNAPGPCSAAAGLVLDDVIVAPTDLVRDGGFEQPVGINAEYGTGPMGAWDVDRVTGAIGIVGTGTFAGSNVTEGSQSADLALGGFSTGNSISQLLPTVAGETYQLTFDWGSEYGWGTHSRVTVGNLDEFLIDLPFASGGTGPASCSTSTWIENSSTFVFTASGHDVLTFTDLTDSTNEPGPCSRAAGLTLDNVKVEFTIPDADGDGIPDGEDICIGDDASGDTDEDGVCDSSDVCPTDPLDADLDSDGVCDDNDACVGDNSTGDSDGDQVCDDLDVCAGNDATGDTDGDAICDASDNCPSDYNPSQADADSDELGDVCDADADADGVLDNEDNCQALANPDQADSDGDAQGDACDPDDDNDGALDGADNCPLIDNGDQADFDADGDGDACDGDDDADGVGDGTDLCPGTPMDVVFDHANGCSGVQWIGYECLGNDVCEFPNHGQYQSCVVQAANVARDTGLLSGKQRAAIVRTAAKSHCGG